MSAFACLHVSAGLIFYDLQHIHYYLPLCLLLYVMGIYGLQLFGTLPTTLSTYSIEFVSAVIIVYMFPSEVPSFDNARRLAAVTDVECSSDDLQTLYKDTYDFTKYVTWGEHGISQANWIYYSLNVNTGWGRTDNRGCRRASSVGIQAIECRCKMPGRCQGGL